MLSLAILLVVAGCAVALFNWRWGILAAILIGLVQDPLRKMIPGTPSYLVMTSMPVLLVAMGSAAFVRQLPIRQFFNCFPRLAWWIKVFAAYLVVPAVISATYGANTWQITLLGGFVYITMFLALVAGWRYPGPGARIEHFLMFYVVVASLLLIGAPLEFLGFEDRFPFIGTAALGHIWVTYRTGAPVHMLSGFFRGPDVMGWHASLVCMISVIMAIRTKGAARVAWIALAVWGVLNIWLCGRRKMLSMIPLFIGCYLFLVFRFKNTRRFVSIAGTVLMIGGLGWYFISSLYRDIAVEKFYLTTFSDAEGRIQQHGIQAVFTTVQQAGFWGYGLGMSQQGVHNIQAEKPRLWQEGGPGKVVAELGVPGSLLFLALGAVLFLTAYHVVRLSRREASFYFTAGCLSILVANLTSAVVSAQIFGDPLITLLITFLTGLLLSGALSPSRAEPVQESE
jgi:hypothetical protein